MLKILIRKQLTEVFKGYFYDAKKNKARSKAGTIAWIIFFVIIMVGLLGGMFAWLSLTLCPGLVSAGMGWLYFSIMSGISILLGAFGSIFNTYSGLYLSKDNDLLLSMPIPVKYVIASRLINVYLMGSMYSVVAIVPALIVYWITVGATAAKVICGILLVIIITVIVLILSCLLGWCVARISLKLSKKSFVKVFASLAFISAYYFFYFKVQELINHLLANAGEYGAKIKGSAYFIYVFGRIGEGDWGATFISAVVCLALLIVVWRILKSTFLSIATSSATEAKVHSKAGHMKEHSVFSALVSKEITKFSSDSNYMLNCGLGILFVPALGVILLIKGSLVVDTISAVFSELPGITAVIFCAMIFMLCSMIDLAVPSVSLEGKNIWIPQSLPVEPKLVLRAKMTLQVIFSAVPILFTLICGMVVLNVSVADKLLVCLATLVFILFSALFNSYLGIKMPLLSWTNEIVPIKQSGAVLISIFGTWVIAALFTVPFFLIGRAIGATAYLSVWTIIFATASAIMLRWLDTRGAELFTGL